MALTYSEYLKLNELLNLQKPLTEGEHDETLFIVIHQVYELWFKQVIHEVSHLEKSSKTATCPRSQPLSAHLTIMKTMVSQIDVLETMSPLSFSPFGPALNHPVDFNPCNFRKLEMMLGKRAKRLDITLWSSAETRSSWKPSSSTIALRLFLALHQSKGLCGAGLGAEARCDGECW